MKTLVIYESAFGNTERVARAIGKGMDAEVRHVSDITPGDLRNLTCVVVGGPTQKMDYTEGMHSFLNSIPADGLQGVKVAAFDTRISIPDVKSPLSRMAARVFLHRYAAEPIGTVLKERGGSEVIEPEGFFVLDTEGPLKEGELERATAWGQQIVAQLA